jgi:hypothetical protein
MNYFIAVLSSIEFKIKTCYDLKNKTYLFMNYLVGTYYFFDSTKQILFAALPEIAYSLLGGKEVKLIEPGQQEVLGKIHDIINQLCEEANFTSGRLKIKVADSRHPVLTIGNAANCIITMSSEVIRALSKQSNSDESSDRHFKNAFNRIVGELPNDPEEIKKALKKKSNMELEGILGLYDRQQWDLTDHELKFVLGHEIKGHALGNDNSMRAGLYLTASLAWLIGTRILTSTALSTNFILAISIGKLVAAVWNRFRETQADLQSVENDPDAREGALLCFKKAAISEFAEQELAERNRNSKTFLELLSTPFNWLASLDYPSFSSRYAAVFNTRP